MEFTFTPEQNGAKVEVPFFEDAREDFAPYYRVAREGNEQRKIIEGQQHISIEMGKLGALVTGFIPGIFGAGKVKRYGYEIRFIYGRMQGIIKVAGLPMKSESPKKKDAVMIQALWNVRDWLKAAVTQQVFSPGTDVLIPYLLVDGKHTIAEYIYSTGKLPALTAGGDVVEGQFEVS